MKKSRKDTILDGLFAGLNYADTYGRDGDENELTEQAQEAIAEIKIAINLLRGSKNVPR